MRRFLGVYLLTVAVPAGLAIFAIAVVANSSGSDGGSGAPAHGGTSGQLVYRLLIATVLVVALAAAGGALARRLGQPPVIGEMAAGLTLGPSVLGWIAPQEQQWLFPAFIMPHLNTLAQFGVVFFMFLVGAELAPRTLVASGAKAVVIGHASIALPLLAGIGLGWWLYIEFPPATDPGMLAFVLFIGVAFAITAFPVLARILTDLKLLRTPIGTTAMAAAGIGDVTAWCLLATVVAIVRGTSMVSVVIALLLVLVFGAVMIWVVKPALAWALNRAESRSTPKFPIFAGIITVVLACALATEQIGVHPIFGAFAAGVVMPRSSRLVAELTSKIEGITMWFMLPIFFVVVGLNTKLGALTGGMQWLACGLITAVAIATKFLGTGIAARATGSPLRDSVALGVMMNCRGLTELVVLTVGLQLGVLSPALFAMFVIMALLTTAMTGPLLRSAMPAQPVRSDERKASQHDPALL